jgi:hypothetical protein
MTTTITKTTATRLLIIAGTLAALLTPRALSARELDRELERLYGHKPTTQEYQQAEVALAALAAADQRSAEAWAKIQPELAEWEKKGKPYIPSAAKPEDLPQAPILAFPGAEGGGAHSFGGRGGRVFVITSLEDSGPGTLREACESAGPRIVVFNVAGIIHLKDRIRIRAPYITIAGQKAPGDGVCVAGATVEAETHDVVIRYLRFRRGQTSIYDRNDALGGNPVGNVIVDHCSASWGLDENLSMYRHVYDPGDGTPKQKLPTCNITIQWCISSEALDIYHHAFGGTWGGRNSTFHHNLFANNTGRNASIGMGFDFNFINNVIFNWRHRTLDGGDASSLVNCINNYYKPGPITQDNVRSRIGLPQASTDKATGKRTLGKWYVAGNFVEGDEKVTADNWAGGIQFAEEHMSEALQTLPDNQTASLIETLRADKPFPMAEPTIEPAAKAYESVLAAAGATLPKRDPVDVRIIEEVRSGHVTYEAGKGIITDIKQIGGYPNYRGEPVKDSDHDGMPDDWETRHGLNPNDASDAVRDSGDGYTNIEKYLNDPTQPVGSGSK